MLLWKWTCIMVVTEGPEHIATIKHWRPIFFFLNKNFENECFLYIYCFLIPTVINCDSKHPPQANQCEPTFQKTSTTQQETIPTTTTTRHCLHKLFKKIIVHWLGLSAFSCCWNSSVFQQFLQLNLYLLNKWRKAGIQQTNSHNGLQVTLCQIAVVIYLRESHSSLSQEMLWKVQGT